MNQVIAANVRRLMRERKLTQKEVAARSGGMMTQATVSNVVRAVPSGLAIIQKIADILGVPLWRLVVEPDSEIVKMADAWEATDEEGRELIIRQLERELRRRR